MAEDSDDDDSQKTEEPSERRLEEAKEKGQTYSSKEIGNFFSILTFSAIIIFLSPGILKNTTILLSNFLENSYQIDLGSGNIRRIIIGIFTRSFFLITIPLVASFFITIISNYVQHGEFIISTEPMIPKLEKLSIIKGFGKIFSKNSVVEFFKNIVKLLAIGIICYLSVSPELSKIKILHEYTTGGYIKFLSNTMNNMLIKVCIAMAALAAVDYLYQRYTFYKSMMMSKQDLKDEYKQTEGSPEIKARLRGIRMERARKRMMSEVPKADVVITNPTHYAVALKYELGTMRAPIVVAKGKDLIALKIKEIAKENKVPIVENPPLARILFKEVDLDKEIPMEHYKAVAEVINYVYKLKKKFN